MVSVHFYVSEIGEGKPFTGIKYAITIAGSTIFVPAVPVALNLSRILGQKVFRSDGNTNILRNIHRSVQDHFNGDTNILWVCLRGGEFVDQACRQREFKINNLEREIGNSVLVARSGGVGIRVDDVQFRRKSRIFEQRKRPV